MKHFTPFKIRRSPVAKPPKIDTTPIAFAVAQSNGTRTHESIELARNVVQQALALAESMDLHYLPTIGLHGATRVDTHSARRLINDLRIILEKSDDSSIKDTLEKLLPLVERVSQDPDLCLLVVAKS